MLSITADAATAPVRTEAVGADGIELLKGLDAAESAWLAVESNAAATPYSRYDWVRSYAAATGTERDIRVVLMRDRAGRPELLWPFLVTRRFGIRVATPVGDKHANFNLPLHRRGAPVPADPCAMLRRIGRTLGVDLIAIHDMPALWEGQPGPFTTLGRPSPNAAPELRLDADPEATAARSRSNEARKRLRNKERGLAKLGTVRFGRAATAEEVEHLLEAFFRQKEVRFRTLGIPDPFIEPAIRQFVREASLAGLAEGRPAIELYGLHVGDDIMAVFGGAADERRLSGMFISFENCPNASKFSPGDILVSRVIHEQCLAGRKFFDLGAGEARYKRIFCDEDMQLLDIQTAVTMRGAAVAAAVALARRAKRRFKANPHAMRLLAFLRRIRSGTPLAR